MKCTKCSETVYDTMKKCPNCGTLIDALSSEAVTKSEKTLIDNSTIESDINETERPDRGKKSADEETAVFSIDEINEEIELHPLDPSISIKTKKMEIPEDDTFASLTKGLEEELELDADTMPPATENDTFASFAQGVEDELELDITNGESGTPNTITTDTAVENRDKNPNIEDTLDFEYEKKINAIPTAEFNTLCQDIKETFTTGEEISEESLIALEYYKFNQFDIQKLIISLYEEAEESGEIEVDKRPDWLEDNTMTTAFTSFEDKKGSETVSDMTHAEAVTPYEEIELPEESVSSAKARVHEDVKIDEEDSEIAEKLWEEFEEETTHNPHQHNDNPSFFTSGNLLYSNLHPRRHRGKITIILILMAILVLLLPTLENSLSTKASLENNIIVGLKEELTQSNLSMSSIIHKPVLRTTLPDSQLYNEYFEFFDTVATTKIHTNEELENEDSTSIESAETSNEIIFAADEGEDETDNDESEEDLDNEESNELTSNHTITDIETLKPSLVSQDTYNEYFEYFDSVATTELGKNEPQKSSEIALKNNQESDSADSNATSSELEKSGTEEFETQISSNPLDSAKLRTQKTEDRGNEYAVTIPIGNSKDVGNSANTIVPSSENNATVPGTHSPETIESDSSKVRLAISKEHNPTEGGNTESVNLPAWDVDYSPFSDSGTEKMETTVATSKEVDAMKKKVVETFELDTTISVTLDVDYRLLWDQEFKTFAVTQETAPLQLDRKREIPIP